jgi:hypothetical protein
MFLAIVSIASASARIPLLLPIIAACSGVECEHPGRCRPILSGYLRRYIDVADF